MRKTQGPSDTNTHLLISIFASISLSEMVFICLYLIHSFSICLFIFFLYLYLFVCFICPYMYFFRLLFFSLYTVPR